MLHIAHSPFTTLSNYLTPDVPSRRRRIDQLNTYERFSLCIAIAQQVKRMHDQQLVHAQLNPTTIQIVGIAGSRGTSFNATLLPETHRGYPSDSRIPNFSANRTYMPPEVCLMLERNAPVIISRKIDIFSFGILSAEIFNLKFNVEHSVKSDNITLDIRTVAPLSPLTMNGFLQTNLIEFLNSQLLCLWDHRIAIDVILTELKRLKDSIPLSETFAPTPFPTAVSGAAAAAAQPPPPAYDTLLPPPYYAAAAPPAAPRSASTHVPMRSFLEELHSDPAVAAALERAGTGTQSAPATPVSPRREPPPLGAAEFLKKLWPIKKR
jgi:hypothetical protein